MKFLIAACMVIVLSLAGCQQKEEGPDYADDEAMSVVAEGLEKRSDAVNKQVEEGTADTSDSYREAIQTELDVVGKLKDRQFEDSELQEKVISYINTLNDSLDVVESYPVSDYQFYEKWQDVYDERTSIINDFVENYDLTVGSEYQDVLDSLSANGAAATKKSGVEDALNGLVGSMVFEQIDEGYGSYTYTATVQNNTGINFGDVSLVLALYDASGVKVEETYASTSSWPAGETVKFEAWSDVNAAQVKVSVDYYEVAD